MNWKNANIKVCRALANHERVCGHRVGSDKFIITVDGCYAYIFPMNQIHFNKDEIKSTDKPLVRYISNYLVGGIDILPTDLYLGNYSFMMRRFKGPNHTLWIKTEYLRHFEGASFCQDRTVDPEKLHISPVLVHESGDPVGLILPVRVLDGQILKEVTECDECRICPANG